MVGYGRGEKGMKRKSWIQPSDAARYFGVSPSTIRHWISEGKLRAAKLPTGHLRILARDAARLLLAEGRAVPIELAQLGHKHVLIVDPDKHEAGTMAAALREKGGCKVTVADSSETAKGMLNGSRPDLVLLGVRQPGPAVPGNGRHDMLILAGASEEAPAPGARTFDLTFRVNDILPTPVDEKVVLSRVANVLLG
jgi:excisionase family DNA binding protein